MSNTFGMSEVGHTHTPEDIKDLGYIPSKTSELENGAGFVTDYIVLFPESV